MTYRGELERVKELDDLSVLHQKVVFAAAAFAALSRIAKLLDRNQRNDHFQIRMWKDIREIDQLVKEGQDAAPFGTPTRVADFAALLSQLNDPFAGYDRFDHVDQIPFFAEAFDLLPNR